jgi:transcriptional regulator with XRE-family HTH domain
MPKIKIREGRRLLIRGAIGMTPEQCQQARELLGWTHRDLAERAFCTLHTARKFEEGGAAGASTIRALRFALEGAGVEFIPENGGGFGAKLRKQRG